MALTRVAARRHRAAAGLVLVGVASSGCSPQRAADRRVVRLLDAVDGARVEVAPATPEVADVEVVAATGTSTVRVRLRHAERWARQTRESIFGERAAELAIWSFRAAFPTRDPASIRLESPHRSLDTWNPTERPRPWSWFHSSGGFFPRGLHLALPEGTAPGSLELVAEFVPSATLAFELAAPGKVPPTAAELVRWASLRGDSRRALVVPGGGEIGFALEVPSGSRLRFAAGRRSHPWGDEDLPSRLELEVRAAGRWRSLASLAFPEAGGERPAWRTVEAELPVADGGGLVELRFRVPEASSRGLSSHFVADPVVVARGPRERRANLLWIVVDGLRADHVGPREGEASLTPNLDRLARRGLSFACASAASTWTRPSLASMFTGRLPSAHGVEGEDEGSRPSRDHPTFAELLRERGWATAALSANPHLDPAFGVARGFGRVTSTMVDGAALESALRSAIDGPEHEPFFVFGFFMDTHWPWTDRPDDAEAESIAARVVDAQRLGRAESRAERAGRGPSEDEIRKLRALYRENVRFVDARIGALLARLDELGLERDTVVVVTADHGEAFGERGTFFHGWNVHRELEHVPLVVAGPGVPRERLEEPFSLVHLPALLLELLGIPDAELSDPALARRVLAGGAAPPPVIETRFRGADQAALIAGTWKLVFGRRRGAVRLYDLAADPFERADRVAAEPERAARMLAELERRLAEAAAARTAGGGEPEGDPDDAGEQLRALGYL